MQATNNTTSQEGESSQITARIEDEDDSNECGLYDKAQTDDFDEEGERSGSVSVTNLESFTAGDYHTQTPKDLNRKKGKTCHKLYILLILALIAGCAVLTFMLIRERKAKHSEWQKEHDAIRKKQSETEQKLDRKQQDIDKKQRELENERDIKGQDINKKQEEIKGHGDLQKQKEKGHEQQIVDLKKKWTEERVKNLFPGVDKEEIEINAHEFYYDFYLRIWANESAGMKNSFISVKTSSSSRGLELFLNQREEKIYIKQWEKNRKPFDHSISNKQSNCVVMLYLVEWNSLCFLSLEQYGKNNGRPDRKACLNNTKEKENLLITLTLDQFHNIGEVIPVIN